MRACAAAAVACALVAPAAGGQVPTLQGLAETLVPQIEQAARASRAGDPAAEQTRYDAARELREILGRSTASPPCRPLAAALERFAGASVAAAEAFDRQLPRAAPETAAARARRSVGASAGSCPDGRLTGTAAAASKDVPIFGGLLPASASTPVAPERPDRRLSTRLAALAASFSGFAGIWIHDLASGGTGAWNAGARFPAASTVKLGVLIAALDRFGPRPERSEAAHDMEALAAWSSNLGANRLLRLLGDGDVRRGVALVEARLRRVGARASTYPGEYRVGTTRGGPPLVSRRTTTARDLGRILVALHLSALGDPRARAGTGLEAHEARIGLRLLLGSEPAADNAGLFRQALPAGLPAAQKHGWLPSARQTAAILYTSRGPVVAVLLTYRKGLTLQEAQALGGRVVALALGR